MPRLGITIESHGGPRATAKAFRTATKEAYFELLQTWHRRFLPGHFAAGAVGKYGYQPRSAAYMRRKARTKHHQKPLVWSGETLAAVRRRVDIKVKATRHEATGVASMFGPQHLYAYRKGRGASDKAMEMVSTTDGELVAFAQLIERKVARRLDQVRTVTRRVA